MEDDGAEADIIKGDRSTYFNQIKRKLASISLFV